MIKSAVLYIVLIDREHAQHGSGAHTQCSQNKTLSWVSITISQKMKIFHDLNKKTSVFLVNSNWNNKPQTQTETTSHKLKRWLWEASKFKNPC